MLHRYCPLILYDKFPQSRIISQSNTIYDAFHSITDKPMAMPTPRIPLNRLTLPALALFAGGLLALMIHSNSQLARDSNPLCASWLAHGIGMLAALLIWQAMPASKTTGRSDPPPIWAYLGGMPGALVVSLAAVTVNSPLAMSGTLAIGMLGQVLFGLLSDHCGWFGLPRRRYRLPDTLALLPILSGCALLIFGA